jgi:hypothetical protein
MIPIIVKTRLTHLHAPGPLAISTVVTILLHQLVSLATIERAPIMDQWNS